MMRSIKRRWMLGGLLVWLSGCHASLTGQLANSDAMRFRGIGLVLVTDAVPGAEMKGVEFYADGSDRRFYSSAILAKRNREIMAYPGGRVPEHVRVVWHDSTEIIGRRDNPNINTYAGQIIGDHTIPVASRIPDEVLGEIRARGGAHEAAKSTWLTPSRRQVVSGHNLPRATIPQRDPQLPHPLTNLDL